MKPNNYAAGVWVVLVLGSLWVELLVLRKKLL